MRRITRAGISFFGAEAGGAASAEAVLLRKRGQPRTPRGGDPAHPPGGEGGGAGEEGRPARRDGAHPQPPGGRRAAG